MAIDGALLLMPLLPAAAAALAAPGRPPADLVLRNARVWTGDPLQPEAEALAVVGERIVAVGTSAEIEGWRGPHTRVLDAGGRRVVPGFNDAHLHLGEASAKLARVQPRDARSPEDLWTATTGTPRSPTPPRCAWRASRGRPRPRPAGRSSATRGAAVRSQGREDGSGAR